jgi:hypothetical protein
MCHFLESQSICHYFFIKILSRPSGPLYHQGQSHSHCREIPSVTQECKEGKGKKSTSKQEGLRQELFLLKPKTWDNKAEE